MHEFAFTKVIYNRVRAIVEREGAERVTDVHLAIGELRGMINDWVARYFAYVGKGTITEGAEVHIETIPGSVRCEDCGAIAPMSLDDMPDACPKCGGAKLRLKTGNEFLITGIGLVGPESDDEEKKTDEGQED